MTCTGNKIPTTGLVGDMRISYAKFRHLLDSSRIKRIIVYGDMKTAVVEVNAAMWSHMHSPRLRKAVCCPVCAS